MPNVSGQQPEAARAALQAANLLATIAAGDLDRRREGPGRRHGPGGEHRGRRTQHRDAAGRQRPGPGRRPAADRPDGRRGRPAAHRARARPRRADRAEHRPTRPRSARSSPRRPPPGENVRRGHRRGRRRRQAADHGRRCRTSSGRTPTTRERELRGRRLHGAEHERRRGQRGRGRQHGPGRGHPGAAEEHGHPAGLHRRQQQTRHAGRPGSRGSTRRRRRWPARASPTSGAAREPRTTRARTGRVLDQSPSPGKSTSTDDQVTLVVGQFTGGGSTPLGGQRRRTDAPRGRRPND